MADTLIFNEGRAEIGNNGLPATVYFLLSTKPCSGAGAHTAADTFSTPPGEITGTGYARTSEAEPTGSGTPTTFAFAQKSWATGSATDWPASVKSVVMVTSANNAGKLLAAFNIQTGGAAVDMSHASTTVQYTPTLTLAG